MKKTLNINIGNSIIYIEEDAYEMLTVYLNEVKQHFAKSTDDFEIVTDIENRIAEMFAEKLQEQQKQAVNIEDVRSIISQMGSVKDFETSEEENQDSVPQELPAFNSVKKLYRNTDRGVVAGVCIGLSHYLNVDVIWIRLFAFLSIFLAGSGFIAYAVLWIMIPRAQTRAEKMEMMGEETNLKGFANSRHQLVSQSRGFIGEFFHVLGNFIESTGKVIFKVIAAIIVFFGSMFLLCLIVALAAFLGFWDSDMVHYFPVSMVNEEYLSSLTFATFITFSVPVLALVLFSIRVAFNGKPINKTLSFGLLIIWIVGVVTGIFYVAKISSEFKEGAEFSQVAPLQPFKEYTLQIDRTRFFTKEDSLQYSIDAQNYRGRAILEDLDNEFDKPRNIRLNIEKSEDGKTVLIQNFKSRGKTFEVALKSAQQIHYGFLQQGAVLNFSPVLWFPKNASWRGQEVELTIKLPVGTNVKISKEFGRYLTGYRYWDCDHDPNSGFTEWVMTDAGFKCKYEHEENDPE
ncbi:PspC domain-containing protein [Pedobacter frigoris]|uniref:PspC domain-containing protein n=1 Tax=Pedobacter frigoris TaxID=2571272 RepID=UPI00292DE242|nr:PspC domain-containing protein [Pedobacter frigoris]